MPASHRLEIIARTICMGFTLAVTTGVRFSVITGLTARSMTGMPLSMAGAGE